MGRFKKLSIQEGIDAARNMFNRCWFDEVKGFSSRNLWNMKDFYSSYRDNAKLQKASAEISWSHNVAILSKCQDDLEREFYMRMAKRNGWSYPVLLNQIDNKNYEQ